MGDILSCRPFLSKAVGLKLYRNNLENDNTVWKKLGGNWNDQWPSTVPVLKRRQSLLDKIKATFFIL